MRKVPKWLRITTAGILGTLLVLSIVPPIILNIKAHVYKGKVDAEIAAIKERGEPVTLADLAGPNIPDDQNGAVIYERILKEMDKPKVTKDFHTLSDHMSHKQWMDDPRLSAEIGSIALRYQPFIPLVEQAVSKPKCKFMVRWDEGPAGVTFPHLAKLRRLSLLLSATAAVKAESGDMDGAVRMIVLGLRMSESLRNESYETNQLVRKAQINIAFSSLRGCLRYGAISEAQARQLYNILGDVDTGESWERSLWTSRCMGIVLFDALVKHPRDLSAILDAKPGSYARIVSKPVEKLNAQGMSFFCSDELFFIRTMNSWIETARTPFHMVGRKQLVEQADPKFPKRAMMSAILLPSGRNLRDKSDAYVTGDMIFLALLAYKDRFGSYPANMGELRAKLSWKIPTDPFSGKDFMYKREGKGFLLYSVGPDLKDDGGKEPSKNDRDKGDIVWRIER